MIQLASTASNHIRYLLQSLDNSNSDSVFQELIQFASYGTEGSILVLGIFFDHLNIYGKDLKSLQLEPAFASVFKYLLDKPNFSTVFCKSVRGAAICEEFLGNLCTALHLTVSEKMFVGLALSYVEDVDIKMCGKNFCIIQFGELCSTRMSVEYAKIVQNMRLKRLDLLMNMLSLAQSKEGTPFIVVPLLSDEIHEAELSSMSFDLLNEGIEDDFDALLAEMEKEMSMADIMKELGYGCTASVLQCKEILSLFLPLTEITVARILGMTVYTYSGLEDNHNILLSLQTALGSSSLSDLPPLSSWNTDVLIDAINQLAPGLNWGIIIGNLDHEGFYVPNEASFSFLMSMYRLACQDPFPLHAICGSVWKNAEGQLSFLRYAVLAPPELFTFAHSGRQLAYVDAVKDHKLQPGHANHAWLCLDLLEVFCQLAERGHASLIRSILEYPLKHCPEVLLLGLAHINTAYNLLQHEVSSIVFPIILKNTLGTGMILYLWNVNPSILLRGFMDAMEDDPDSINKVLDSCQELQILSPVLDMIPYSFGIRLAALASYKEFIDLGKWLNTNLRTYKDNFYEECLKFIKEAFFSAEDDSTNRFRPPKSLLNSYLETASVFMKALQSCTGSVSSLHLSEELEKLTLHLSEELEKLNLTCMDSNSSLENIYADSNDIEASANSYFKLMFSEQLTIESMIQMLVHFKESSEKREKSIFKVMISSLFEEYKFFPKYPDNQLKTAAIIFGSLIKHHLVTHLNLKITLKAVLDALQEPADTRMFGFGTLALEQFEDVLIELPGFCYHISKIPHLCAAKPQLIQFIEHEYARASVVNSELDEGNNFVATQFPGSIRSSQSSIEGSTLPLTACGISYPEMQVTSHIQLPQREHSTLDTRKLLNLHCQANPALSSIDQAVAGPSSVATCIPKLHSTPSSSAANSYSHGIAHPARANSTRGFGSALNIETLVAAAERRQTLIEVPPSEVQDKISFIMNNLSAANIKVKAKEIVEILKEEHYPWFAQYIVMKRASIEPNYQALYVKLLDEVNLKELFKEVVQATYENCKVLLQSGLIKSSSEESSLLKNLGSWLGKITIGRDQVLLAREINPKSLIIEAYEKGLMIAVIPFTSKILESCQNSLAYQLPNAWTMAILGLLVEIHAMPTLKMNLKFDIEVLFKNLGVDLKDINPTSLLKDRVRELEGNPDFSNKDAGSSQPQFNGDIKLGIMSNLNQGELSVGVASMSHPGHQSHIVSQHAASVYLPSRTLTDKGKLTALVSDQHLLPSAQGLLQGQTPFSVSQLPTTASNIEQQVIVNPKLHEFGLHSHFQSVLPIAMKKAIEDIVMSIVHRSISIATQTTKELVLKDYAMEPNQTRIRNAAHLMVASLAGSLAHATCKESLWCSISSQLRNTLEGIDNANELLELAIQVVTNDNLDLGCALIEQIAITKAIQIIDETIAIELASMTHREEPTYTDSCIYTEQCRGVLPEALSPNSGHLSYSQQRGYEDFVCLPWQNQSIQSSNALSLCPASSNSSILSRAYVAGSAQMSTDIYSSGLFKAGVVAVPNHLDIVSEKIDSSSSQLHSASLPPIGVGDGASSCNFGNDSIATPFSSVLLWPVRPCNVVKGTWRSLQPRNPTPSSEDLGSSVSEPSLTTGDAQDKYQIILEKVPMMFDEWYRICEIPGSKDAASANYVLQLHHSGLLNGDDVSDCFFHKLMEISVLHCLSSEVVSLGLSQASETKTLSFLAIDIYAKLVYSLVKFYPVDQGTSKISLLYRVLAVTVKFIQRDSEEKKSSFDPRPYFRLFINWIFDLCSSDPIFDGANFQVLTVLASAFHALQPLKVPGFSFAWLELVTHRCFMPKLLTGNAQKGWPYFLQLLVDMFRFMEPFLSTAELREPVRFLYEGTLRVLLVLHHDFPEFLCDYHFSFCDMIPPTCAQMRNIVLSAVPHNIKPPNPSVCGLTIDLLLPELRLAPRILSEVDAALKAILIKSDIDQYLKTRQMASLFLSELKQTLILSPSEAARAGTSYNVPLINSLVLYVGIWAVQYRQPSTAFNSLLMANRASNPSTVVLAACDIFLTLMDLDKDGCYWFLNAIANQLRYPNNHTHYFSIVMLHLFASSNQEIIQEQIIRVILERLVVKPPHPWGLLVIFRELTENKDYNLWNKSFIRSSPDIANLLRSLMRGKLPNPPVD